MWKFLLSKYQSPITDKSITFNECISENLLQFFTYKHFNWSQVEIFLIFTTYFSGENVQYNYKLLLPSVKINESFFKNLWLLAVNGWSSGVINKKYSIIIYLNQFILYTFLLKEWLLSLGPINKLLYWHHYSIPSMQLLCKYMSLSNILYQLWIFFIFDLIREYEY